MATNEGPRHRELLQRPLNRPIGIELIRAAVIGTIVCLTSYEETKTSEVEAQE